MLLGHLVDVQSEAVVEDVRTHPHKTATFLVVWLACVIIATARSTEG